MRLIRGKDTQNVQKKSKRSLVVTNIYPENHDIFNSTKPSAGMKTYVQTFPNYSFQRKEKILYYR